MPNLKGLLIVCRITLYLDILFEESDKEKIKWHLRELQLLSKPQAGETSQSLSLSRETMCAYLPINDSPNWKVSDSRTGNMTLSLHIHFKSYNQPKGKYDTLLETKLASQCRTHFTTLLIYFEPLRVPIEVILKVDNKCLLKTHTHIINA